MYKVIQNVNDYENFVPYILKSKIFEQTVNEYIDETNG